MTPSQLSRVVMRGPAAARERREAAAPTQAQPPATESSPTRTSQQVNVTPDQIIQAGKMRRAEAEVPFEAPKQVQQELTEAEASSVAQQILAAGRRARGEAA